MPTRRRIGAVVAAAGALLVAAADARAQWTPPFEISAATAIVELPQAAVDRSGTATVVWTRYDGSDVTVHARRIDASGAGGPILDVSEEGESLNAQVAVDAAGNATVVWTGHDGATPIAQARRITAAGELEDVKTLSAPGETGFGPAVVTDAAGDATVVWTRYDNPEFRLQTRRIDASGALGPIDDVTPDSESNIEFDLAGSFAVWRWNETGNAVIQGRWLDGGAILDLSDTAGNAFDPQVAVDPSGVATAVWYRDDGVIQARRSTTTGLHGIVELSAPEAYDPEVAVDQLGAATVVWSRYDGTSDLIESRRLAADGTRGPIEDVAIGVRPRVAVDGLVAWIHDGAVGVRGTSAPISPAGGEVESLELATDAAGRTIAVWTRLDGATSVIAGARFVVPAPPLPPPPPVTSVPAPQPSATTTCAAVTMRLKRDKAGRVTLRGAGRVQIVSAKLSLGKRKIRLRFKRVAAGTLRAKLPRRRVRVVVKARARAVGCPYGKVRTLRLSAAPRLP